MSKRVDILSKYFIIREIGRGGCGVVYLVKNTENQTLCALKKILASASNRELRSIQLYRRFAENSQSENLIPILDSFLSEGNLYYTMPLSDGIDPEVPATDPNWRPKTLEWIIENQKKSGKWFSSEYILDVFLPISKAAGILNDKGLVHRDIKPSNILFFDGKPCLADIGLMAQDSKSLSAIGTPDYMPPYWYLKSNGKADMWGLATTLFNFISGYSPDCIGRVAFMWPECGKDSFSGKEQKIFNAFHQIIFRATNQDPKERFIRISDFASALKLAGDGLYSDTSALQRTPRGRLQLGAKKYYVLGLLVVLAALLFYLLYPRGGEGSENMDGESVQEGVESSENSDSSDSVQLSSEELFEKIEELSKTIKRPEKYEVSADLENFFNGVFLKRKNELREISSKVVPKRRGMVEMTPFPSEKWNGLSRDEAISRLLEISGLLQNTTDAVEYARLFEILYDLLGDTLPFEFMHKLPYARLANAINMRFINGFNEFHWAIQAYHILGRDNSAEELVGECTDFALAYSNLTRSELFSRYRLVLLKPELFSLFQGAYENMYCYVTQMGKTENFDKYSKFVRYMLLKCETLDLKIMPETKILAHRHFIGQLCQKLPRLVSWIIENDPETLNVMASVIKKPELKNSQYKDASSS